jgi:hypothetical protein
LRDRSVATAISSRAFSSPWWYAHGFVTWGDWKFFEQEYFCGFYDAQALSMIDGRFDVPPAAIGDEAFIFQGKAYGYFGIGRRSCAFRWWSLSKAWRGVGVA